MEARCTARLHGVMHLIEDHAKAAAIPIRFAAAKLLEGDRLIQEELKLDPAEIETIDRIAQQMETERGLDRRGRDRRHALHLY